jgi:hypothetical protein
MESTSINANIWMRLHKYAVMEELYVYAHIQIASINAHIYIEALL